MTAKDMFEKLGYEQKENSDEGIQYIQRDKDSEMQRIGMISTRCIEFYKSHKEIVFYTTYEHRNGKTSASDCGILNIEEFNAVQKQVLELGWNLKD